MVGYTMKAGYLTFYDWQGKISTPTKSGHFDGQISNSTISHDKYPTQWAMHLLCEDIFKKTNKQTNKTPKDTPKSKRKCPLLPETDHQYDAGELCSTALLCTPLLWGTNIASVNETHSCSWYFTFDWDNDRCQATKMQLPLCKNVSV